ncbi:MAG: hypothetical protein ABIO24_03645, partial [Saprospiraceae bacterium]
MHKSTLIRGLLLLLFALGLQVGQAQVIFSEDFGDQATSEANWINGGTNVGSEVWMWTNDPTTGPFNGAAFTAPTADNGFFNFDSDANGENAHDVTLTGPSFDASASTNTQVTFWSRYAHYTSDALAELRVSVDGGSTWTAHVLYASLAADLYQDDQQTVAIPEANGKPNVKIQFRWKGQYEYAWQVDDIEVSTVAAVFADVTFRVNTSQITVDAGGMRLAGSFNGWTDELMTNAGNGIWTITKSIQVGETIQYKFKNGPNGWEQGQAACGVSDNNGGYNRTLKVLGDIVLPVVCFNSCSDCPVVCNGNVAALICDDFESYTLTTVSPQATWWKPWDAADNNAILSADVSADFASNGTKSMKVRYQVSGATQGDDQLLLLGGKTTGRYSLKWKMYIPTGNAAYYNIQNAEAPVGTQSPDSWTLDVYFYPNGFDSIPNPVTPNRVAYPHNTWFQVEHIIDLDNDVARLYINGQLRRSWKYTKNLGSVDFYSAAAEYVYYVDEVEYVKLPDLVIAPDACETAVDLTQYLGQAPGIAQSTPSYDNTNATASPYDPAVSCWDEVGGGGQDLIDNSLWFSFVGDGYKYHIQTDSCSAGFLRDGDTQMAVFTGNSCLDLNLVACNDDIDAGNGDFRSAVDIETQPGQIYYVLVDGFNIAGNPAQGTFCFQITRAASIDCAAGMVGTLNVTNDGFVCAGQNLNQVITLGSGFVLPTNGEVNGLAYVITTIAVPAGTWPADLGANLLASTRFLTQPFILSLPNDEAVVPAGQYYLTPIVLGGGSLIDPATANFLSNVDPTSGCFFVGASIPITLIGATDPLAATATVTNSTPPGNNGSINLTPSGAYAAVIDDPNYYGYEWSNGASTQDISGLAPGIYTVTVSDATGCEPDFVLSVTVGGFTATNDPASLKSLTISPNPTPNNAVIN